MITPGPNAKLYVVGFAFNHDRSRVVLIEKNKPDWQRGFLNGVGGKVEPGEDFHTAMAREFQEETGVGTLPAWWDLFAIVGGTDWQKDDSGNSEAYVYCFDIVHDGVHNSARTREEEVIGHFNTADVPHLKVIPNLPVLVPLACSSHFARPAILEWARAA